MQILGHPLTYVIVSFVALLVMVGCFADLAEKFRKQQSGPHITPSIIFFSVAFLIAIVSGGMSYFIGLDFAINRDIERGYRLGYHYYTGSYEGPGPIVVLNLEANNGCEVLLVDDSDGPNLADVSLRILREHPPVLARIERMDADISQCPEN